jgi:diguanylate cyclase (GGDEF)-like protein/PAS domain S-box-containing protein
MLTRNPINRFLNNWVLPDQPVFLLGLLLLGIIWVTTFWQIGQDRQSTISDFKHDGDRLSHAFEEHVRQVLMTLDQYTILLKEAYETDQAVTPQVERLLRQMAKDPSIIQIALIDAKGKTTTSHLPDTAGVDRSGQSYFQAQRTASDDRLFVGRPIIGMASQKMSIPLSRRLNHPDGSFAGLSYLTLNPKYFTKIYQDMNFNEYYTVRILGLDGIVRASSTEDEIGCDLSEAANLERIAEKPAGVYWSSGTNSGKPGFMSYRSMPDYPLVVQVWVSNEALFPLQQRRLIYLTAAAEGSLFILLFTGSLVTRARRQRHAELQLRLSEEKYCRAFQVSPDSISISRILDGKFVEINEGFTGMTGYVWEDVAGKTSLELDIWVDPSDRIRLLNNLAEHEEVRNLDIRFRRKDGSIIYGLVSVKRINVADEECLIIIVRDITERKQAEIRQQKSNQDLAAAHEELIATEEKLRKRYGEMLRMHRELSKYKAEKTALLDAIPDLMLLLDRDGILLDYERPADFHFFAERERIVRGRRVAGILPQDIAGNFLHLIQETLATGRTQFCEYSMPLYGVNHYWEVRFSRVNHSKVLAMIRDTTAIRRSEEQVEFLTLHDSLTGVYNRAYYEEAAPRLQATEHKSIGMLVCDVDGLKLINDTLGHRHGDELLKQVAALLNAGISPPDFTARIGGDEFAVVLCEPTKQRMKDLETRYKHAVINYNKENPHLPLSLSVGWAISTEGGHLDQVFKEADNNMYRQKMHQSQSVHGAIVQTMMKALEARDHITEGHADRIGKLMVSMGQKLQISQGNIADLLLLAKFHDIGKVGIPDSILNKSGKLTSGEMAVMQRHCEIGFRIARSSPDLEPIADWVLKHHEHWNGNGYPLGLAGEEIPVECRILGIIDAYDAMTSDRPYRKAMSSREAIAEIRRYSGTQFDPLLAERFIDMLEYGFD